MKIDLKKYLEKVDAILISSNSNIIYLTSYSNFSISERECFLLITKNKRYLITDKRYSEALKRDLKDFEIIDIGATRFLSNCSDFLKNLKIKKLGFEDDDLKVNEYTTLRKSVILSSVDLSDLRILKTQNEIKNIKSAANVSDKAFEFITKKLKVGVTEKEIAFILKQYIEEKSDGISFDPIVAFGENSSIPHHLSGNAKLKKNQIVLLDFGAKINNYSSDMTRTVFFGKADHKFKEIYETVLQAQKLAIEKVKPGATGHEVDDAARDFITSKNFSQIPHSVGHGIGINVHEKPYISPNSHKKISENMVFSIEPGIYITSYGGVRIEDLVLVTKSGVELISNSKKEIIEI